MICKTDESDFDSEANSFARIEPDTPTKALHWHSLLPKPKIGNQYFAYNIENTCQGDIHMLAYHRNDKLSHVARELFQESTSGLAPVAAALPDLAIAGGYFHYTSEPLVLIPHLFLLDEAEKRVVDVLNGDDGRIISYYVAGTLDEGGVDALMNSIRATGEKLKREGFRILPRPESMKLLAA